MWPSVKPPDGPGRNSCRSTYAARVLRRHWPRSVVDSIIELLMLTRVLIPDQFLTHSATRFFQHSRYYSGLTRSYPQLYPSISQVTAKPFSMAPEEIADHATSREHGKFVTGYGKNSRYRYAARTVENSAKYLVPYMEKLAAKAQMQKLSSLLLS